MCINKRLLLLCSVFRLLLGQDSSAHPELYSERYFDEYESAAGIGMLINVRTEIEGRCAATLQGGPFSIYYRLDAKDKKTEQLTGLSFALKAITAGIGRGQPHIARGMILGNTMMRYGTDPAANYRMGSAGVHIKNYPYYKHLQYLGFTDQNFGIAAFRYDNVPVLLMHAKRGMFGGGAAAYFLQSPLSEGWLEFRRDHISASINMSMNRRRLNHFSADLLFREEHFRCHLGSVWKDSLFRDCRSDASWGSGLAAGSFGICGSIAAICGKWRLQGLAQQINGPLFREGKMILELRYGNKPFGATIAVCAENESSPQRGDDFPFALERKEHGSLIMKQRLSAEISRNLKIDLQLQADMRERSAGFFLCRFSHQKGPDLLRIQYLYGRSGNKGLYALRPSGSGGYTIYRLPLKENGFLDLMYKRNFGAVGCALAFSNSGFSISLEI